MKVPHKKTKLDVFSVEKKTKNKSAANIQYRSEVVVHEDHIGGFLWHVRPGFSHRYADVRATQSDGVVDTVARHADDVSCVL